MCDKKELPSITTDEPPQPITLGQLQEQLNELLPVYIDNGNVWRKSVVFDFPFATPARLEIKANGARVELVAEQCGGDSLPALLDRIEATLCEAPPHALVWVAGDNFNLNWKPAEAHGEIGVVGVKDNGEEIILITAYLG